MFESLFENLSHAIEGAPAVAIGAAFLWGILSIILSPCHLASIPLIVGFINGQGDNLTTRRAAGLATLFALGILITIAGIGAITAAIGRVYGDIGPWGTYIVAAIFLIMGLHLMGVIPMPFSGPGQVKMKGRGLIAAFMLGLIFGIALGPCTFGFMAPVLGATFEIAKTDLLYAVIILSAFAIGHCLVIIIAGTCTTIVQRYLNWTERSRGAVVLRGVCGVLVILGGLYLLYKA